MPQLKYVDMMMARKTIVLLVGYLFIGVGGLDNSELYWENGFESSSWSLLLENTSVKEYIAILWTKMNDNRLSLFKKVFYCPQGLAAKAPPWGRCSPAPPPRPAWSRPPCRRRTSAPPWMTLVVVRIIFAWCHSFLEFNSSPLWFDMNVPSSTSIVNGFW